jgi:signal peptidase I
MESDNVNSPNGAEPKSMHNKVAGLIELARTVVYAVVIAVGIRTFAYEPFSIPSGSMIPTLLIGDYLFVSKFAYGYSRHSMPFSLPLFEGRVLGSAPERGDVAVFKYPVRDSNFEKDYIKRIVGLPGDRIQVVSGILHINGEPVRRLKVGEHTFGEKRYGALKVAKYLETLPNGRRHELIEAEGDFGPTDNTVEFVVPAGHFFAMGDNRDNSLDSRFGWTVPYENLVGRAEFLFFSKPQETWFFELWGWRFGRFLDGID